MADRATSLVKRPYSDDILGDILGCETQTIILHKVKLNPCEVWLNIKKSHQEISNNSENWYFEMLWVFLFFWSSAQSKVFTRAWFKPTQSDFYPKLNDIEPPMWLFSLWYLCIVIFASHWKKFLFSSWRSLPYPRISTHELLSCISIMKEKLLLKVKTQKHIEAANSISSTISYCLLHRSTK